MEAGHPVESPEAICSRRQGIVNRVEPVFRLTLQLIEALENSNADRDVKIQRVQELLAKREVAMDALAEPYLEDEMAMGMQLVELNGKLTRLMEQEKGRIQKDIRSLNVKKETHRKYVNPYQGMAIDGVFYDKKN